MAPLPLTVFSPADEPAFGLLSRLAARNFCSTQEFCDDMGLSRRLILGGEVQSLTALAGLAGADADVLIASTPRHKDAKTTELYGMVLNRAHLSNRVVRGCPVCIARDLAAGHDPYIRSAWLHELNFICADHHRWLTALWNSDIVSERLDTAARFVEQSEPLVQGAKEEPLPYDRWIASRLTGNTDGHWLDQFEFQVAVDMCDLLGRSLAQARFPKLEDMSPKDRRREISVAFSLFSRGEEGFREAIAILDQRAAAANEGPAGRYGVLYRNLDRYLTDEGYEPFRNTLRQHTFNTWPIAAGQMVLGVALEERRLHSLVSASQETGCPPERLRSILALHGHVRDRGEGAVPAREIFEAVSAGALLDRVSRGVTLNEILRLINISRSQMETLRLAGFLEPDIQGEGFAPLWAPVAALAFLESLMVGSECVESADPAWVDIGTAGLRLRIPPGDIVNMRLAGDLPPFGRREGIAGYRSLVLRLDVLAGARPGDRQNLNAQDFARLVGMRWPHARRLVMLGLTPSTLLRNPGSGALQRYITPDNLAAFHARYVTLMTLSRETGKTWQATSAWLRALKAEPFTADGGGFGQLFERSCLPACRGAPARRD